MRTFNGPSGVKQEAAGNGPARDWRGRRALGGALLVATIAAMLAGCVVAPGYVAPAPVYYAPAPVVVATPPIVVYGRWGWRRW